MRGHIRPEGGSAAVEFAMVMGLLVTLMFGMGEFGLMLNSKLVVIQAAREGARRASVDGGSSEKAREVVMRQLELGHVDLNSAEVTITPRKASYGSPISVRVQCVYRPVTPIIAAMLGAPIPLRAEVVTRSEKVR